MKVLAVINPISGGKDKYEFKWLLRESCRQYGIELEEFNTTSDLDKDKARFARQLEKTRPERVLSVGGDGTLLFTVTQLIGKQIPVGIIPFGSANGMAVELGISMDPAVALEDFLISRYERKLDLIKVNGRHYCMHIGDVGLNARVVEKFSKDENRGFFTYAKYFISELQAAELIDFSIKTEEGEKKLSGYLLALANARKYGSGAMLNNIGSPFDGKFELVAGLKKDIGSLFYIGLTRFSEEIDMNDIVEVVQCKTAEISLKEPHILQLDGEVIGKTDKIKAEIVPGAVPLILLENTSG